MYIEIHGSMRAHTVGQCSSESGKWLPRLSKVHWRTLAPMRSGAHQAVSEVRLPGGLVTRGRTSDEHARSLPEAAQKSIPSYNSMALQTEFQIPALIPLKFIRGKARIRGVGC